MNGNIFVVTSTDSFPVGPGEMSSVDDVGRWEGVAVVGGKRNTGWIVL